MSKALEAVDYQDGNKPVKPSWRKRSEKFFNDSTFNGALYVFASRSWIKRIFWAVIILIAIGGFMAITVLNILTIVREPTATSITLTRERELAFPAVTICSLSLLNTTVLKEGGSDVIDNLMELFDDVRIGKTLPIGTV